MSGFSVLTQAWKSWKSARAIALLAVIAFAVGIGSTTAIYTVVNTVMLKPLPYPDGDRFVELFGARFSEPDQRSSSSIRDLLEYQRRLTSFDVFGWFRMGTSYNLTAPGEPQHINGTEVTPSLAHGLGVNPVIGRWFTDETGAVISNALWRRLGADRNIVGQGITLNDRKLTITGVMPSGFRLPVSGPGTEVAQSEVWIYLDPLGRGQDLGAGLYFGYARRKPGVALARAEAEVKSVAAEIARLDPVSHRSYTARLDDLREITISEVRPTLLLLFAAAGLLLLITCANVAGLLLARAVARARETATRVALGASRWQLALQYFVEGLFLSVAGAAVSALLGLALVRSVLSIAAEYIPRADEIAVDWKVFLFGLGTAFGASALSSLAPLWQAVRTEPSEVLSAGVRASAGARVRRLSQSLVVAEIALAFALLAVSATLVVHLRTLNRISPGFDPDQLLTFELTIPGTISSSDASRAPYQKRLTEALERIPGVSGVAFVNHLPLAGCCMSTTIHPEGRTTNPDSIERTSFLVISPAYFRAMRIPLRSGRFLNEADTSKELVYAVINQAAATHYWPDRNPVGAYGHFLSPSGDRFQVVGVVGNVRNNGLGKPTVPEIYLLSTIAAANPLVFIVRSPLPAERLLPEIRRAIRHVDPSLPIHDTATMNAIIQESLALERVGSFMTTCFALAALLLATLGVYGVVSFSGRQRTVEIGTRMALGAARRDVLALVVGGGLKMAMYGVVIGGVAAMAGTSLFIRLFDVHNLGLIPTLSSTVIIAIVATAASFFPAWRATLVSPMVAIRDEPRSTWQSARESLGQAAKAISHAAPRGDDNQAQSSLALLTDLTDATRGAESFADALRVALATLCARLGAESAMLLEHVPGGEYRCSAAAGERASLDCSLPARGFLLSRLESYPFPLALTGGDFDAWSRWAEQYRPGRLAEIQALRKTGARIAVPLRTKNETLGVLLLGPPAGRDAFSLAERQVLRHCAEQFALMIQNARLTDRVVEQEKLRRDLALAVEVQRRLLPQQPPESSVAALAAVSLPARSIGGDYYDFIDAGDGRIGIALADVAGKGVAAALIMSVVQASLRIISSEGDISLPHLVAKMNRFLHRSTASNSYATFFYAQFDTRNHQLRYVNAGHNPPFLLRARDGHPADSADSVPCVQELSTGGTVLGLFPEMSYEEATLDLRPGDVLVAFTDGVTEAMNPEDEEFGEARLKGFLLRVVDLPVVEISARISDELNGWTKHAAQYDDMTFIVMKVN